MSARSSAKNQVLATGKTPAEDPTMAAKVLSQLIESGARVQAPAVKAYVERLRAGAPDATPAELVTKPLEQIVKGIDGVDHVYSRTEDDRVTVTARLATVTVPGT